VDPDLTRVARRAGAAKIFFCRRIYLKVNITYSQNCDSRRRQQRSAGTLDERRVIWSV
jgi:hypothetical protein